MVEPPTLIINITNNAPISIELTSIAIVLSNGSYIALYKGHTDSATVTIAYPSGAISTQALEMPLALGTGYSINISIPGLIIATPKSISIAVTASPIVVTIPIKPYIPTKVTAAPKPSIYLLRLERYLGKGTVAILKEANGAAYTYITGTIKSVQVSALSYTGLASDLQILDNHYLNATSERVPANIILSSRNARVYTNFTADPFTQSSTSPQYLFNYSSTSTGEWYWGPYGYVGNGVKFNDSLTASAYFFGLLISNALSEGLAFNNGTAIPVSSTANWSIYAKIYVPSISSANFTQRGTVTYAFYDAVGVAYVQNTTNYYLAGVLAVYSSSTSSTSYYLAVLNSTSSAISIGAYTTVSISPGWYIIVAEYNASVHGIEVYLYATNGTLLARLNFVDTSTSRPNPSYAGIGTVYYLYISSTTSIRASVSISPSSLFDDLVSGLGNITSIKVLNVPIGYSITLLNSTGGVVSSISVLSEPAVLNIITQPIVSPATVNIYNSLGNTVLSKTVSLLLGGDTYVYLPPRYQVLLNISSAIDLSGVINDTSYWTLYLELSMITNNTYVNVSLEALDLSSNQLIEISSSTNVVSLSGLYRLSPPLDYINTSNGLVNATLVVYSSYPFNVSIDLFNAKLHALRLNSTAPLLIVGAGGTDYIDIYQVSTYVSGPSASYLYSINAHTLFNGSASFTYSPANHLLYLLNTSGIYYTYIVPNANFTALNANKLCRATGAGAQIAFLNVSGYTFLVVVPGGGNSTLCIVNASSSPANVVSLSLTSSSYDYTVSAYSDKCVWIVLNSSGAPELVQICNTSYTTITPIINVSTVKNVGLAYCPSLSKLVLLAEGGPSYVIDVVSKTVTRSLNPPFYPVGVGDRLGCYNGYVFFVELMILTSCGCGRLAKKVCYEGILDSLSFCWVLRRGLRYSLGYRWHVLYAWPHWGFLRVELHKFVDLFRKLVLYV